MFLPEITQWILVSLVFMLFSFVRKLNVQDRFLDSVSAFARLASCLCMIIACLGIFAQIVVWIF